MPRKPRAKGKTAVGDNLYILKGSYWFRFTYKGKTYTERIGRVDEIPLTSARHIAGELRARIIRGEYIPVREEHLTFRELTKKYLDWYKSSRAEARQRTIREMERKVELLISFFGSSPVQAITELTVEDYKRKRREEGVKPNTINTELTTFKAILNKGKEWGLISTDLPRVRKFKVDDSRVRYLTPEELGRLLSACPEWFRPVVEFAVLTGLRASEIFSLRWENVNLKDGHLTVESLYSKNKEVERIPLHPRAVELLKGIKEAQEERGIDHGYIFTNSKGEPYSVEGQGYKRVFKNACKRAGIENFRFHDLRHTFASYLALSGVDLYTIQHLTRHRTTAMVKRYAHLSPEHLRNALGKMEQIFNLSSTSEDADTLKPLKEKENTA